MARHVFFSFYFQEDVWRVSQIRNAWVANTRGEANPILDWADWETIERKNSVRSWIDGQLVGASVTVVLFGENTYRRPWVKYEILKSHEEGKGLLAVSLVGMKDRDGRSSKEGQDPIQVAGLPAGVQYSRYSWIGDDGRANMERWVEEAARRVGR